MTAKPTGAIKAESVRLIFTLAGWAEVRTEDDAVAAAPGTILTIPAERECQVLPQALSRAITFHMHPEYLADQVRWLSGTHPLIHDLRRALSNDAGLQRLHVPPSGMRVLAPPLARLTQVPRVPEHEFAMLSIASDVFHLVGLFAGASGNRIADDDPTLARPREEVVTAIELMRDQLSRDWRIDMLAREVAISDSQLRRLFRSQVGVSPAVCLTGLRCGHMAELLATTSLSVSEAAKASGWQNPTVASRAFKNRFGVSPREYAVGARRDLSAKLPAAQSRQHRLAGETPIW